MKTPIGSIRGKSAFEQAVAGGYTGTEAAFNLLLAHAVSDTIQAASVVDGDLVVTKLDGTTQNLGRVRGQDGANVLPTSQAVAQAIVEPGPARDELTRTIGEVGDARYPSIQDLDDAVLGDYDPTNLVLVRKHDGSPLSGGKVVVLTLTEDETDIADIAVYNSIEEVG